MTERPWLIRVASHPRHGGGHVARCAALASALSAHQPVVFILDHGASATAAKLRALGFDTVFEDNLPAQPVSGSICDGYEFDKNALEELAARGPLAVMDDFLSPPPQADLAINAACHLDGDNIGGIPALLGPAYALVDRRFVRPADVRDHVERVVVTFGLLDPDNITAIAIAALVLLAGSGFRPQVDIVICSASPHLDAVSAAASRLGDRARLVTDASDMVEILGGADLVIGAGGVSLYERAAMGIPSISTSIIGNQDLFVAGAGKSGITVNAGTAGDLEAQSLAGAIEMLAKDAAARCAMSKQCQAVIDGRGARRIADALQNLLPAVPAGDPIRNIKREAAS